MKREARKVSEYGTLGILAGQGSLPLQIIQHCKETKRKCFVLGFEGNIEHDRLDSVPHAIIRFGAIGEGLQHLRNANVEQLVLAGNIKRPSFMHLKPDVDGARLLKRMSKAIFGGDDALLRELIKFLEDESFEVLSVDDVLGGMSIGAGNFGTAAPDKSMLQDIEQGIEILRLISDADIGQALVIENGYILGVEAAEGTDGLIIRCAPLMRERGRAILIKGKKINQETRADMPTIGPRTIENLAKHNYAGTAIEAHVTMVVDAEKVKHDANQARLFVYGF